MMPGLQLTCNEFATEVRISRQPYILVEGPQDKSFLATLSEAMGEAKGLLNSAQSQAVIETAEYIQSETPGEGNREKVEKVSEWIGRAPFQIQDRYVGFVDREFREFRFGSTICDSLQAQRRVNRLVWSRGHSIENYLLDFDVFRVPLRDSSLDRQIAQRALERLREYFSTIVNIACALGLAARQTGQLRTVRNTVHWASIDLSEAGILWNVDCWKAALDKRSNLCPVTVARLATQFEHWLAVVQASPPTDVRWACDGHIGLRLVWHTYAKLVHEISQTEESTGPKPNTQRDKIVGVDDRVKLNHLARSWTQDLGLDFTDTPGICFEMVGVSH